MEANIIKIKIKYTNFTDLTREDNVQLTVFVEMFVPKSSVLPNHTHDEFDIEPVFDGFDGVNGTEIFHICFL